MVVRGPVQCSLAVRRWHVARGWTTKMPPTYRQGWACPTWRGPSHRAEHRLAGSRLGLLQGIATESIRGPARGTLTCSCRLRHEAPVRVGGSQADEVVVPEVLSVDERPGHP